MRSYCKQKSFVFSCLNLLLVFIVTICVSGCDRDNADIVDRLKKIQGKQVEIQRQLKEMQTELDHISQQFDLTKKFDELNEAKWKATIRELCNQGEIGGTGGTGINTKKSLEEFLKLTTSTVLDKEKIYINQTLEVPEENIYVTMAGLTNNSAKLKIIVQMKNYNKVLEKGSSVEIRTRSDDKKKIYVFFLWDVDSKSKSAVLIIKKQTMEYDVDALLKSGKKK
ncbi:hypothetical protein QUF76_10525 [Desulfobacterales bacterium HSG16]|nr:hypothetical protein [Desulfobacterales bacterium HSG16]